jgi:hypothetical protein
VGCTALKGNLSVRTSAVRNDQAIQADLRRRELNSREAGTFRNALELCQSVSVAIWSSGQHHHAEGSGGGRRNAIGIGNEFGNRSAAAWLHSVRTPRSPAWQ